MPFKTASSTIALTAAAAFALSTSAFAQTMVGGQDIGDEDLPMVTAHCEMLAGEPATHAMDDAVTDDTAADDLAVDGDAAGIDAMDDTDAGGELDAGGPDIETDAAPEAGTADDDATTTDAPAADTAGVDIDAISIEDCQAAGLAPL